MTGINVFSYIDAISFSKTDIIRESENPEETEKKYSPFMTNRALSYHIDSIMYVNEMNIHAANLPNIMQFDYLINSIRKRKRFAKWSKPQHDSDLEMVMGYYNYGRVKAEAALKVLTSDQLAIIKSRTYKGGANEQQSGDRGSR